MYRMEESHAGENGARSAVAGDFGRVAPSVAHGKMNASPRVNNALPASAARRETPVASDASDDDDDDDERWVPTRAARTTATRDLGADVDDTAGAVPMRPGDARARPMRAPRGAVPRATDIITRRAKWASVRGRRERRGCAAVAPSKNAAF